ncbi:MAG: complex I subunit 4 family protein [Planctomycetota bacterium]|jgi:NADH-quinone oxidoreductase subunit M
MDSWYLTLIIAIPAAAGLGLVFVPKEREGLIKRIALFSTLLVLGISVGLFFVYDTGVKAPAFQFVVNVPWIESFGIHYKLGIDGISLLMVVLTALLAPISIACSWNPIKKDVKGFFISMLLMEAGMLGVFCALDLFLFYVFWEASLIPMYLIIGIWGGKRRIYAAVKFILYTIVGSLLMLAAILYCWWQSGLERPTFDVVELQQTLPGLATGAQVLCFAAFGLAFAIKVPMFPFHTWLPDAHVEAPTAGSVILAGILLKMGGYGFIRFAMPFFPDGLAAFTPLLIVLAIISVIYGALMALAQSDIKKLIAYSSVSHMGFVMLGLLSATALNIAPAQGAVMQMVNHGLSTGALFLLVGIIYDKTHRRGIDDFGGLAKSMPVYAAIFMVITLSSIGLPGLNGFVSEFLVLLGSFQTFPVAAAFAGVGIILGAVYMLRLYRLVFFGRLNRGEYAKLSDVGRLEIAYLLPIVLLVILLGVLPGIVLNKSKAAVQSVYLKIDAGTTDNR